MTLLRALTHALIILALALITAALATRGLAVVLRHLSFGSYLPFALATAAALNNQKGLLIATILITILTIIPCTTEIVARALVPIGAGVLLGVALQRALTEAQEPTDG